MAVRLSALSAGRPLPPGRFLVLISVRGSVNPCAIVPLEGLSQSKNPMTSSGTEPATFRLVAYYYGTACPRCEHIMMTATADMIMTTIGK
jgi:hypothetical protein